MEPRLDAEFPQLDHARSVENKRAPADADRAVGAQIRRLRRTSGMTLMTLGKIIGVSAVQLQRYEVGTSRIAASRLLAIAAALDVRADMLLGEPHPRLAGQTARRQNDDAIELVRVFNGISDPAHRRAIIALIRAVAVPPPATEQPVGAYAPIMPMGLNGSIPAARE